MVDVEEFLEQFRESTATPSTSRTDLCREALAAVDADENPALWARLHVESGICQMDARAEIGGPALEQAISHFEQALSVLTSEDYPEDWAAIQTDLGDAFVDRVHGERGRNLEQAIEHYRQALTVYASDASPQQWAMVQSNMGRAYHLRPTHGGPVDHRKAIAHYRNALTVYNSEDHPEQWATTQNNIAIAYSRSIDGANADNVERAIKHFRQVLAVRTREAFPEHWAATCERLADAFDGRVRGEVAENLDQAIAYREDSLCVYTPEHAPERWARARHQLGFAYMGRMNGERAQNVEEAIAHFRAALEIRTREDLPEQWAETHSGLGFAYQNRVSGERADNIERAIEHYELSLTIITPEAFLRSWLGLQINESFAFFQRIREDRSLNTERALEILENALAVCPLETYPELWGRLQSSLGSTYACRVLGERADNLEQSIQHHQAALDVFKPETFPWEWAATMSNLGLAYMDRIRGTRADNLERAISCRENALTVYSIEDFPEQWAATHGGLGLTYRNRIRGDGSRNLDEAIRHYEKALTIYSRDTYPDKYRFTQRDLGELHLDRGRYAQAHDAFATSIEVSEELIGTAYTEDGRIAEVDATTRAHRLDAYALLRLHRADEALLRLEEGKTQQLRQEMALEAVDLGRVSAAEKDEIQSIRQSIRAYEAEMRLPPDVPGRRSDAELANSLREARADLSNRSDVIRANQTDAMADRLDLQSLLRQAPEGGAMVAPLITSQGTAVFVIPAGAVRVETEHVVEIDRFKTRDLDVLLFGADDEQILRGASAQNGWLGALRGVRPDWEDTIDRTCRRLWDMLIEPVHRRLADFGLSPGAPVLLVPPARLGLLPLHAALREDRGQLRCMLDDWSVYYAPSFYGVSLSRNRLAEPQRQGRELLAVVNPTEDLHFATTEADAVVRHFPHSLQLKEAEATVGEVLKVAPGKNFLHFTGHGSHNWSDVMRSGLQMAENKDLTLSVIIEALDLSCSRLVVLSACETGITDTTKAPEEFTGLPSGLLSAGTPGVISSLWSVDDLSTSLVMERFYQNLFADGATVTSPSAALREAQLWLRDSTADSLDLANRWRQVAKTTRQPELGETARENADYFATHKDVTPFSSPYFWAGFTYMGAQAS